MPELPEVQTVVTELSSNIVGKILTDITERKKGTVIKEHNILLPQKITSVNRRGKYIIIYLESAKIIVHFRMTGKLIIQDKLFITTHTRSYFSLQNGAIIFDDIRTFGKIWLYPINAQVPMLKKLGVEPLKKEFDKLYLKQRLNNKKAPVKNLLLDQTIIAGLGNIYVCELLYRARINPDTSGCMLTDKQLADIVKQTKIVLTEAIKNNGTTISDYRRIDNKTGAFQNFLKVYQKDFCECGEKNFA